MLAILTEYRQRLTIDELIHALEGFRAPELARIADAVIDRLDDIDGDPDVELDEDVGVDDLGEEERCF